MAFTTKLLKYHNIYFHSYNKNRLLQASGFSSWGAIEDFGRSDTSPDVAVGLPGDGVVSLALSGIVGALDVAGEGIEVGVIGLVVDALLLGVRRTPCDLGTLTSPDIGGGLSVDGSNSGGFLTVGPVHGVCVLSGYGDWNSIIVWDLLDEIDATNESDEASKFEHY